LFYLAAHGNPGRVPAENTVSLWGGDAINAIDLARIFDRHPQRQARVVITSCFSGGFAELAFEDADPLAGGARHDRCGFFASRYNQEASGCDPDPERRKHQGYGIHFLNALEGRDREGKPAMDAIDTSGDGKVSLLEADSFARVRSLGIDVPTRTSEWWLRSVAPFGGGIPEFLAEDSATIEGLQARLGAFGSPPAAKGRLLGIDVAMWALSEVHLTAGASEPVLYRQVGADLLAVWPVLNDPWHPLFRPLLDKHRAEIRSFLDSSEAYGEVKELGIVLDGIGLQSDALRVARAPLERLLRAYDNRLLAGALRAKGGRDWERYQAFLACERGFAP
jgi:hypothetical protein